MCRFRVLFVSLSVKVLLLTSDLRMDGLVMFSFGTDCCI